MTVSKSMQSSIFLDVMLFFATAAASTFLVKSQKIVSKPSCNTGFAETTNATALRQALKEGKTLNATENVCTVDGHNTPSENGHSRAEMRLERLWHRATYIIIRHIDENAAEGEETYLLVQRRSNIKDYCPGKLDPTPGGVVGFGESYKINAERELMEEMNIDISADNTSQNSMKKLFTFPYEDDVVRVWGCLFEATYRGSLLDIKMQPEEVSEVLRLSISDIERMAHEMHDDWMPDGLYAIQLYLQRRLDEKIGRRLLHGYSSGDLDRYALRPKPKAILFDCDDCLYFDGWKVANLLTAKIEEWCTREKQLAEGEAYQLYKKHGTALKGLLAEGHMEHSEDDIDEYLRAVHDLPISDLIPKDEELRKMIERIDPSIPKYIFTASVRHHAERCLEALGIDDLFEDIIDVKSCNLATKHSRESFEAAMHVVGIEDGHGESVIFFDDSTKNIEAARQVGWRSILVGKVGRDCGTIISSTHAEHEIDRIHDMPMIFPELFL